MQSHKPKLQIHALGIITEWNQTGSDFFIPETTLMILCTKKAKEIVEGFKVKNIKLENIKTLEWYNA